MAVCRPQVYKLKMKRILGLIATCVFHLILYPHYSKHIQHTAFTATSVTVFSLKQAHVCSELTCF